MILVGRAPGAGNFQLGAGRMDGEARAPRQVHAVGHAVEYVRASPDWEEAAAVGFNRAYAPQHYHGQLVFGGVELPGLPTWHAPHTDVQVIPAGILWAKMNNFFLIEIGADEQGEFLVFHGGYHP